MTVLAVAPAEHALAKDSAPAAPTGSADQTGATKTDSKPAAVTPSYGLRKVRVGVQIKNGSWVPIGTKTGGSKVKITEKDSTGRVVHTETCTTQVGSENPPSTETYCSFTNDTQQQQVRRAVSKAAAKKGLKIAAAPTSPYYFVLPGNTVTFQQITAEPHLVVDPVVQTVGRCVTKPLAGFANCPNSVDNVTFNDPGLPPIAVDDKAKTMVDVPVDVAVLSNDDDRGAPITALGVVTKPKHGKAVVVGTVPTTASALKAAAAPADPTIRYTPSAGYVGTDVFTYSYSTANGKATATVRITIAAPPPIAHDDSAQTTVNTPVTIAVLANDDARGGGALRIVGVTTPSHGGVDVTGGQVRYTPNDGFVGTDTFRYTIDTPYGRSTATVTVTVDGVANTGAPTGQLTELGLLLLVIGGGATVAGRRRRRVEQPAS